MNIETLLMINSLFLFLILLIIILLFFMKSKEERKKEKQTIKSLRKQVYSEDLD